MYRHSHVNCKEDFFEQYLQLHLPIFKSKFIHKDVTPFSVLQDNGLMIRLLSLSIYYQWCVNFFHNNSLLFS